MWLNGFNNNIPGYPKKACDWVRCPDPYMGPGQPGAPPDSSLPPQGPFGSGEGTNNQRHNNHITHAVGRYMFVIYVVLLHINLGGFSSVSNGKCPVDAVSEGGDEVHISI